MGLAKIVSGGQTGVDRAALDAALAVGFPCGGWCPADRRSEDGVVPERYPLTELTGGGYRQRTRKNVQDSDGTAILFTGVLSSGTKLTRDFCVIEKKPFVLVNAREMAVADALAAVLRFVEEHAVKVLNVAGPRASGWPQGHAFGLAVIGEVIRRSADE